MHELGKWGNEGNEGTAILRKKEKGREKMGGTGQVYAWGSHHTQPEARRAPYISSITTPFEHASAVGAGSSAILQVVCTHQLGLLVLAPPPPRSNLAVFLHSSDFMDVEEEQEEEAEEEGSQRREERGQGGGAPKRRRTDISSANTSSSASLGGMLVIPQAIGIVRVASSWAHALLLDGAPPLFALYAL